MDYPPILEELKRNLAEKIPSTENCITLLSETLHVDPRTVSRKLRGITQFTITGLLRISKKTGISVDSLYDKVNFKHSLEIYYNDFSLPQEYQKVNPQLLYLHRLARESENSVFKSSTLFYYFLWICFYIGYAITGRRIQYAR